MGRLAVLFAVVLVAASASAQTPDSSPRPDGVVDVLNSVGRQIESALSAPKPGREVAKDGGFFTVRFLKDPQRRGLAWPYFAQLGSPLPPAAFGARCSVDGISAIVLQVNPTLSSKTPYHPCRVRIGCTAQTTRASGCYEVDVDVCLSTTGEARIDKITGMTKALEWDFKTPAKVSACSREADRLANGAAQK